ncbi:MAG: hypothetical protein HJJLKODD_02968 [Phycisphaerae bacterium]|nr:hypothetical protein [Phycisphaerae bacterium]
MRIILSLLVIAVTPELLQSQAVPHPEVTAAQFPNDDAVILRWEQSWNWQADGSLTRRDHRWVRVFDNRAAGEFADPRIDYRSGQDELKIHAARTYLPSGEILPVPEYSFNPAAPDDLAGWPVFADWRQQVISFSGFQPGSVVELDYEITSPAGQYPWLALDLRLHEDWPIVERIITIDLPEKAGGELLIRGIEPAPQPTQKVQNGMLSRNWQFQNLEARPAEPQSVPWQERCGRLRFSTLGGAKSWAKTILPRVEQAAKDSAALQDRAGKIIGTEVSIEKKIERLTAFMHDQFSTLASSRAWRDGQCRPAAATLSSGYGHALESGALLLALCRAAGLTAEPWLASNGQLAQPSEPLADVAVEGIVVQVTNGDETWWIHPQQGILANPGIWGRRWLVSADDKTEPVYLAARGELEPSHIELSGNLKLSADGLGSGEWRLVLTGLFYNPVDLRTAESQQSFLKRWTERALPGVELERYSLTQLSPQRLEATLGVKFSKPLPRAGELYTLTLSDGPLFLPEVPLPLERSERNTAVRLSGPVHEEVLLNVQLPEGWSALYDVALPEANGPWGRLIQNVPSDKNSLQIERRIDLTSPTIDPTDFATLRTAVNALRTTGLRTIALATGP